MVTFILGGLLILWLVKMSFIELSKTFLEEDGVSETETT
jgi:hypothetical protein